MVPSLSTCFVLPNLATARFGGIPARRRQSGRAGHVARALRATRHESRNSGRPRGAAVRRIWRPVKGDEMAQNGGLRPSPYSVFLHESCRYPLSDTWPAHQRSETLPRVVNPGCGNRRTRCPRPWSSQRRRLQSRSMVTAPAIPAPATNTEGNGVGIAVRMPTMIPFPAARPRSSCGDPRCWMRVTAMPRATPTGTDATHPTPRVATMVPKSMESTATTPPAAAGWIPMTPRKETPPPPVLRDFVIGED